MVNSMRNSSDSNYHRQYRSKNNSRQYSHVLPDDQIGYPYIPHRHLNDSHLENSTVNEKANTSTKVNRISSSRNAVDNGFVLNHRKISNSKGDLIDKDNSNLESYNEKIISEEEYYPVKSINIAKRGHSQKQAVLKKELIGQPIPLPYLESHTIKNRAKSSYQKSVSKDKPTRKTADNHLAMSDVINETKSSSKLKKYFGSNDEQTLNTPKRHIQVIITATSDKDVVRICNSILKEYSRANSKSNPKVFLLLFFSIVIVLLVDFYVQHYI